MSNTDKVRKLLAKDENGLLPCPFCGAELYHAKENYYYRCKTDGCFLSTHFVSELQSDEYNTRSPALSELLEDNEKLRQGIADCERLFMVYWTDATDSKRNQLLKHIRSFKED